MVKIILLAGIVILWILGGQWRGKIRDVGVPILLGLGVVLAIQDNILNRLLYGILTCGLTNIIRLGYGNYSPQDDPKPSLLAKLTHDRQGWRIRLIWGGFVGAICPIALVFAHYLSLPKYALFCGINALLGFLVSRLRLPVILTDILVSASIGSILLLL
jgi:hypothetical protein